MNYLRSAIFIQFFSGSMTGLKTPDHFGFTAGQAANQATSRLTLEGDQQWDWKTLLPYPHCFPHHSIVTAMSIPSSSPERGALPQLECPSSPPGMDPDPSSTGSPVLSPDSSSHDAVLSAPAASPADSENLSPDELELLAKLEEQNRWELFSPCLSQNKAFNTVVQEPLQPIKTKGISIWS